MCDLGTDCLLGTPFGKATWGANCVMPAWLSMPFLWLARKCLWPLQLLRPRLRRVVSVLYRPFYEKWDESAAGTASFEGLAVNRTCALESLASKPRLCLG